MTDDLINALVDLARDLPESDLERVLKTLQTIENPCDGQAQNLLYNTIPHEAYRHKMEAILKAWQTALSPMPGSALALALRAAVASDAACREDLSAELVWTGPATPSIPLRRTDRVLLELIASARHELWIVSFVVVNVPTIGKALKNAIDHGVTINLIVETEGEGVGILNEKQLKAISKDFNNRAHIYFWPLEQRSTNNHGKHGSLHVKCAIADRKQLFVSSANLTEFALSLNMELGVVLQGKLLPERVVRHFETLVQKGILVQVVF